MRCVCVCGGGGGGGLRQFNPKQYCYNDLTSTYITDLYFLGFVFKKLKTPARDFRVCIEWRENCFLAAVGRELVIEVQLNSFYS